MCFDRRMVEKFLVSDWTKTFRFSKCFPKTERLSTSVHPDRAAAFTASNAFPLSPVLRWARILKSLWTGLLNPGNKKGDCSGFLLASIVSNFGGCSNVTLTKWRESNSRLVCWCWRHTESLGHRIEASHVWTHTDNEDRDQRSYTVILQIFGAVLFSVLSVVKGFTEIKKTPK